MYADGINKAVRHMKVYPAEFYFFWVDFEPWTPLDSASIIYFLTFVLSQDGWNMMLRERLLEVYDRDLVEKILPVRPSDYFQHDNMMTISDEELERIGMLLTPEEAE